MYCSNLKESRRQAHLLEEAQSGERPRDVQVDHFHALFSAQALGGSGGVCHVRRM